MEKTAKRMLQDSDVRISADSGMGERIIDLMKEYARQIANKALKDAAERATLRVESIFGHKCTSINLYSDPDGDTISIDKESITNTKIITL